MNLSKVYDEILADPNLSEELYERLKPELSSPILECACGSGDLLKLIQKDFEATGLDLDAQMLELAKEKGCINLVQGNMLELKNLPIFNTILCLGDSLNYLLTLDDVNKFFLEVYNHLNEDGQFIFDMHTQDRLVEFKDPYIEEANMKDYQYQWTINSDEDYLIHQFVFYRNDETIIENVIQRVYSLDELINSLKINGFKEITYKMDENHEKIQFLAKKEEI